MWSIFKKSVPPFEAGMALFHLILDRAFVSEVIDPLLQENPSLERERLLNDVFLLRLFACQFFVVSRFTGPTRDRICDGLYHDLFGAAAVDAGASAARSDYDSRAKDYDAAIQGARVSFRPIGATFAKHCGADGDFGLQVAGVEVFRVTLEAAGSLIGKFRIGQAASLSPPKTGQVPILSGPTDIPKAPTSTETAVGSTQKLPDPVSTADDQPKGGLAKSITASDGSRYRGLTHDHSIAATMRGGKVVVLDDGSVWEVYPRQAADILSWSPFGTIRIKRSDSPLFEFDHELSCSDSPLTVCARLVREKAWVTAETERRTCARCGLGWALKYFPEGSPICTGCMEKERRSEQPLEGADAVIEKIKGTVVFERLSGGIRDFVDGASGRFGYDSTNPIPAFEERGQAYYCSCLRCSGGHPFWFQRLGNVGSGPDGHVVDVFELLCFGRETHIHLYFDFYHRFGTSKVPDDLSLAHAEGRGSASCVLGTFPENVNGIEPVVPSAPWYRWDAIRR